MPVYFGQEEPVNQTRAPVNATPAMPDRSLAGYAFDARKRTARALDVRVAQRPIPFHPELDVQWPEGMASAINAVLEDQRMEDALCNMRGLRGDADYPRVAFNNVLEEEIRAPIAGFKQPQAPVHSKINPGVPQDMPVQPLQERHIASVLSEEIHGFRRVDAENAAIISRGHPQTGSRLAGRRFGMARQQNPVHFKKPRFGLHLSNPALPGCDYGGFRLNNGMLPDQRRLPDPR
jgi:hypothetical protein